MEPTDSYGKNEIDTNRLHKEWNEIIQEGLNIKKKHDEQAKFFTKLDQAFFAFSNKAKTIIPDFDKVTEKSNKEVPVIPLKHSYKKGEKHESFNSSGAVQLKLVPEEISYQDLLKTLTVFFDITIKAKKEMERTNRYFKTLLEEIISNKATSYTKQLIDTLSKLQRNIHKPGNLEYFKEGNHQFIQMHKSFSSLLNLAQLSIDEGFENSKHDIHLLTLLDDIALSGYPMIQKYFGAVVMSQASDDGKDEELDNGVNYLIEIQKILEGYRWHITRLNLYSLEALHTLTKAQNFNCRFHTIQALFLENLFD